MSLAYAERQVRIGLVGAIFLAFTLAATAWAAIAAAHAARAAESSVNAFLTAEMPHVIVRHPQPSQFFQNGKPKIRFTIGNWGRSPAWVRAVGMAVWIGDELPPLAPDGMKFVPFPAALAPGESHAFEDPILVDWDDLQPVVAGQRKLVVFALIEFADSFGRLHRTRCAFQYVPGPHDGDDQFAPTGDARHWGTDTLGPAAEPRRRGQPS